MNTAPALVPEISNIRLMPTPKQVFAADLFDRFIDYTDCKESTIKGYLTCIRAFARWMQEEGIVQPTRDDIKAYKEHLAADGYKAGTQQQYLRTVKHFFKWTAAEGLYPNIADNIKCAKVRNTEQYRRQALTMDEATTVDCAIDTSTEAGKRLHAMFLLAARRGLRTIEISRLNIGHIHRKGDFTLIDIFGKGHDEADTTRYLDPDTADAIAQYMEYRKGADADAPLFVGTSNRGKPGAFKGYKKDKEGKIICDATTGEPVKEYYDGRIAPTTISTMIKNALKEAGFNSSRITAHSARHTAGTSAAKLGDLYSAQKFLRHQKPDTTEIYMHMNDEEIDKDLVMRIYNAYHHTEGTEVTEAHKIIDSMTPDKLEKALAVLRAMA